MIEHWVALLVVGAITFAYRWSCIGWFAHHEINARVKRWLQFVPPAAFAALTAPELFVRDGTLVSQINDPRLLAGLVAALVAWKTRNVLSTIVAGMALLFWLNNF